MSTRENTSSERPGLRFLIALIKCAMCAVIGYLVPLVVLAAWSLASGNSLADAVYYVVSLHGRSHAYNRGWLGPSVGCAVLFGLAALISFLPPNGKPFRRSLVHIGIAALIGAFAMKLWSSLNELDPVVYTEDLNAFRRMAIAGILPTGFAIWELFRPSRWKTKN